MHFREASTYAFLILDPMSLTLAVSSLHFLLREGIARISLFRASRSMNGMNGLYVKYRVLMVHLL